MFRGVDTRRHWPKQGMTSKKWLDVRIFSVSIDSLVATQDGIYFRPLMEQGTPVGGDEYPHVVFWNKTLYLEDGHHRVFRAILDGETRIIARVLIIREGKKWDSLRY